MPVRDLQARLTSRDFAELIAYESVEGPMGPWREDFRQAALMATIMNAAEMFIPRRGRRKRWSAADFMPSWWSDAAAPRKRYPTAEELEAKMSAWAATLPPGTRPE